jgi:hypothetical protein
MAEPYMTMAEIEAKYPNEWVLIDNPKLTRYQEVLAGVVVMHSADRAEFHRRLAEWDDSPSKHLVIWFTGKFPTPELLPVEPQPGVA